MRQGHDHNGILEGIHQGSVYGSRMGLFPEFHYWIGILAKVFHLPTPFTAVLAFIKKNITSRRLGKQTSDRNDFLTKLMDLRENDKIEELDLITTMGANIAAGSDTTAISLSTIIYYLLKNPHAMDKLVEEIDNFAREGKISDPVTFQEGQQMPYLQAVIKEALRIHPATGQPMSRIVPPGGAEIAGQMFPGGVSITKSLIEDLS
jgi:cytochrome P450